MGTLKINTTGGVNIKKRKKTLNISTVDKPKNDGSLGGYLGQKAVIGLAGIGEGIYDFTVGSVYQLMGDKEYAKYLHDNDVVGAWNARLDRDYNPSGTVKVLGDIAEGVGQALPSVALGIATGGTSTAVQLAGSTALAMGYAGRGITDAVKQTGELGFKENAYGIATGALESVTDAVLGAGQKTGKALISGLRQGTKAGAKQIARNTLVKGMLSSAASEAAEEFIQEYADTALLRLTGVNREAEYSLSNALYSAFIGGVTGGLLGGAQGTINATVNLRRGQDVMARGNTETLINTAKYVREVHIGNSKNFSNLTSESLRALTASVDAYNALSDKTGTRAAVILGEIKAELAAFESSAGIDGIKVRMMNSDADVRAQLAEQASMRYGKTVTAEDIAKNNGDVTRKMAIESFVSGAFSESATDTRKAAIDEAVAAERIPYINQSAAWNGESSAQYRDPKSGKYIFVEPSAEDGKWRIGYSMTAQYDENRIMQKDGLDRESVKKALAGIADESMVMTERGIVSEKAARGNVKAESISTTRRSIDDSNKVVLNITQNSELANRIANSTDSKYKVIRDYLFETLGGQEFIMSDGRKAIMDKRDAQELAHNANEARTAQLGNLKKIIENAVYRHSVHKVNHKKFSDFHYYEISVRYKGNEFDLWLNVGVGKNDKKNHIYSITNKKEEAPTNYGVARPVGYALQNASSNTSISQNPKKSTAKAKKVDRKFLAEDEGVDTKPAENAQEGAETAKEANDGQRTRYDIAVLEDGKTYVRASRNVITAKTLKGMREQISDFFNTLLGKKKYISVTTIEGDTLVITKDETEYKARDNYRESAGKRIELSEDEFIVKLHAEAHIDELAETSHKNNKPLTSDTKGHNFAKDGFEYRNVYFHDFDGKYYQITLSIGHNGTVATVYNVGKIKEDTLPSAKIIAVVGSKAPWNVPSYTIISKNSKKSTAKAKKVDRKFLAEDEGVDTKPTENAQEGAKTAKEANDGQRTRYDIEIDADGNQYVKVDETLDIKHSAKEIVKTLSEIVRTKFKDFTNVNGQKIGINVKTAKEWVSSKSAEQLKKRNNQAFVDKIKAFKNADEILQIAKNYIGEEKKHQRKDNFVEFARGIVSFVVEGRGYQADVIVGTTKSGAAVLYDLVNIGHKKIVASKGNTSQGRRSTSSATTNSIPQKSEKSTAKAKKVDRKFLAEDEGVDTKPTENAQEGAETAKEANDGYWAVSEAENAAEAEIGGEKNKKGEVDTSEWSENERERGYSDREATEARSLVKNFDELSREKRMAIIEMMRSADDTGAGRAFKKHAASMIAYWRKGLYVIADDKTLEKGFYRSFDDGSRLIVVNPLKAGKAVNTVFLHELGHDIWTRAGAETRKQLYELAVAGMSKEEIEEVRKKYKDGYKKRGLKTEKGLLEEEIFTNLLSKTLDTEDFLERLDVTPKRMSALKRVAKSTARMAKCFFGKNKLLFRRCETMATALARVMGHQLLDLTGVNQEKMQGSGVRYSLKKYDEHQIENWKSSKKIVLYENDTQFRQFIENAKNTNSAQKMYFGAIPKDLATEIKKQTGIDVENYNCSLSSDEIRKIFKDHGDEKKEAPRGQRAVTDEDILKIPLIIQNPDSITLDSRLYNGKPVIVFVNNSIDVKRTVVAVVSDKRLDLFVQTAYVGVKKGNLSTPTGKQVPINTPKASSGTVSSNIISQKIQKSTSKTKKVSENGGTIDRKSLDEDAFFTNAMENGGVISHEEAGKLREGKSEEAKSQTATVNEEYTKKYQNRIQAWDGETEGFSFVMGESPKYLTELTVKGKKVGKKQVRIDATKIKKILHDHSEMTIEVIKELPSLLNDPILVLDSKSVEGRLVLLGEVYANGKPVMMALEINPTTRKGNSNYIDVIKIASAYTRSNTQNLINLSNIRYKNESRVDDWLKVNRLQLPLPNSQSDSATNSIPQKPEKSTTKLKKSKMKKQLDAEKEQRKELLKSGKLFAGMTDEERYRRLKKRTAQSVKVDYKKLEQYGEKSGIDIFNTMIKGKTKDKTALLKKLGEEFAVFKGYSNEDVDLKFTFSKSNLSESIHHQKIGYDDLLKMMSCFDGVVENAVGLEVHNRNDIGYKTDKGLNNMYVLVSSFTDGKYIIPVRLEIKEFSDKGNVLYVAVSLGKIKKSKVAVSLGKIKTDEVVAQEVANGVAQQYAHPSVTISIPRLLSKINPIDKNLLKYIPDNFLTGNRLAAKKKAIAEQLARENKKFEKNADNAKKIADERAQKEARAESGEMMRITRAIDYFKNNVLHRKGTDGAVEGAKILADPGILAFAKIISSKAGAYHALHETSRQAARVLLDSYYPENPLWGEKSALSEFFKNGGGEQSDIFGAYKPEIRNAIEVLANGEGQLSAYEIKLLDQVVGHVANLYKTYDTVILDGKRRSATELAYRGYKDAMFARGTTLSTDGKGGLKRLFRFLKEGYLYSVITPEEVLRDLERHVKDGVLSSLYRQIRLGEAEAGRIRATLLWDISEWLEKHDKYYKSLDKERFEFGRGTDKLKISTSQAVSLYETAKREHAKQRLFSEEEGVRFRDADGEVHAVKVTKELLDELYRQFSDEDREYIKLIEKTMAACKKYKVDTDMEVMGYTNAIDGHYYPIVTDQNYFAKDITDIRQTFGLGVEGVRNKGFNQNTVQGAQAWLFIEGSQRVLERHVLGISQYAGLFIPLQSFGKVYGGKFDPTTGGKPVSVVAGNAKLKVHKTESLRAYFNNTLWGDNGLDNYLIKLFSDIQRVSGEKATIVDRFISFIRSGYVNSVFGLNLKIIATQLAAYPAAYRVIDTDCLTGAFGLNPFSPENGEAMDKYSRLTLSRRFEGSTAAEGLIGKLSELGKKTSVGIELTDRRTILALYSACQLQVEKDGGAAVGTEENLRAAGELLDNLLLDTQTTALQSDRSELMRSRSEFAKILTMFKTEAMKSFSQMYGSISSYADHKRMAQKDDSYADMLEDDKKRIGRNVGAYAVSTAWVAALSIAFSKFYNIGKEDDEELGVKIAKEAIGGAFDLLPIVSDIAAFMIDGYDMDSIPLSVINDSLSMIREIDTVFDAEKSRGEKLAYVRQSAYTVGKLIGWPIQNTYKLARTAVAIANRPFAYVIDNTFDKSPSYKSDLDRALESGNERLAQTVMRLWMSDRMTGEASEAAVKELTRLYSLNDSEGKRLFSAPRTVPSSLSAKERAVFTSAYSGADGAAVSLLSSKAYNALDDAAKAQAIKACYDVYFVRGQQTCGLEVTASGARVSEAEKVLDPNVLYAVIGYAKTLTGEQKKAKIIKYLISLGIKPADRVKYLAALGYKVE